MKLKVRYWDVTEEAVAKIGIKQNEVFDYSEAKVNEVVGKSISAGYNVKVNTLWMKEPHNEITITIDNTSAE